MSAPMIAHIPPAVAPPSIACEVAATQAERRWRLPAHLLAAIGEVESGRRDAGSGRRLPWPWSVHVDGVGYAFGSAAEAATVVGLFRAHGVDLIDVGCFQVNLHYHPEAFASTEAGFDPAANADAAGRFLRALYLRDGGWEAAIGSYHSADPALDENYRARVLAAWRRMDAASVVPIPVYTPATLPAVLRAGLGLQASTAR